MEVALGFVIGDLAALDCQEVFLDLDVQVLGLEAGDRDLDAVGVLGCPLDVVGRIAVGRLGGRGVEQIGQAIKADDGAVERRKIDGAHVYILLEQARLH